MSKEQTSALYYLVFHCGMNYQDAMRCYMLMPLEFRHSAARSGSFESRRCFRALGRLIKVITN